ncbi:PTS sugar transporter subunit IIA [Lactococcus muris]|uniref:Ascorbate-specific PTS system EIIA component n=1 Tax=Lactococcus muris TaxID=2941330 RepID=A0ABV4D916_9LACT
MKKREKEIFNKKREKEIFNPYIQFKDKVETWQEAIQCAAQPLLENGLIEERYIDAMIQNVIEHGEYIILVPKVALPHARPESGAKGTAVSILRLEKAVAFSETEDVSLIICLATRNNTEHLELLTQLSSLIDDEEKVELLLGIKEKQAFIEKANEIIQKET